MTSVSWGAEENSLSKYLFFGGKIGGGGGAGG